MNLKLSTESGLSWATIRGYARSELLERDGDCPLYMHHGRCQGACEFDCNGKHGFAIAQDVQSLECSDVSALEKRT